MKRFLYLILIFYLFFYGCKHSITGFIFEPYSNDIRESVFRYQFFHNYSGQQQNSKVYFLALCKIDSNHLDSKYSDPPQELMNKFKGNNPPVKKFSLCNMSVNGVFDKENNQRGLLFRVGNITWIDESHVQVDGGYFEGGLSASGNIYYVEYIDGQWIVTKDVLIWIA